MRNHPKDFIQAEGTSFSPSHGSSLSEAADHLWDSDTVEAVEDCGGCGGCVKLPTPILCGEQWVPGGLKHPVNIHQAVDNQAGRIL